MQISYTSSDLCPNENLSQHNDRHDDRAHFLTIMDGGNMQNTSSVVPHVVTETDNLFVLEHIVSRNVSIT
ncbi:unnamed protein product [Schistosoma mattheei]|uniref:Uncharacterized protein n=1 Tax=Schistosoma mattheei TaxID=31246 RepID=A0A183PUI2_9TREM|nr:unnamed protein product [Schistosoma mattheei]